MLTRLAMWWVRRKMQKDRGYAIAWHSILAMSAQDEGVNWVRSQRIAGRFMDMCFDVDTSAMPEFLPYYDQFKDAK